MNAVAAAAREADLVCQFVGISRGREHGRRYCFGAGNLGTSCGRHGWRSEMACPFGESIQTSPTALCATSQGTVGNLRHETSARDVENKWAALLTNSVYLWHRSAEQPRHVVSMKIGGCHNESANASVEMASTSSWFFLTFLSFVSRTHCRSIAGSHDIDDSANSSNGRRHAIGAQRGLTARPRHSSM